MNKTSGVLNFQAGKAARCFVSVNPELAGSDSPVVTLLYLMEDALHKTAGELGIEYFVIAGAGAEPPPGFGPQLFATLSGTPIVGEPCDWPKYWTVRRSRELCEGILTGLEKRFSDLSQIPPTTIYVPNGHPTQIPGLIRLGLALRGRCPIIANLSHLHAIYGLNRPHEVPAFRELLRATRGLRRAANLRLCAETERLAAFIRADTGEDLPVLPFYTPASEQLVDSTRRRPPGSPLRIAYPTAVPSRSKGFDLVIALAERLGRSDVEIVTREPRENSLEICLPTRAAFAGGLKVLPTSLLDRTYEEIIAKSDLVLIPYPRWQFFSRTSGVLADAIRFGKPIVGTADCWIGDQIDAVGGGKTFRDGDADSLVDAVRAALDDLEGLRAALVRGRQAWAAQNNRAVFLRTVLDLGGGRREPIGVARRDWLLTRLAVQLHAALSWRSMAIEPALIVLHRLRRLMHGKAGKLWFYDAAMSAKFADLPAIAWRAHGVSKVELRIGSPAGFRIAKGGAEGNVWWAAAWLPNPSWIYLQDASDGIASAASRTLARMRFKLAGKYDEGGPATQSGEVLIIVLLSLIRLLRKLLRLPTADLTVSAPVLTQNAGTKGTISFGSSAPRMVDVTVNGRLFTSTNSPGTVETGPWLKPDTTIFLLSSRWRRLPVWFRILDAVILNGGPRHAPLTVFGSLSRRLIKSAGLGRTPRQTLIAAASGGVPDAENLSPLAQALLTAVAPGEWGLAPPSSSGEVYVLCAYSRAFLDLYGGERLVIFAPRSYLDILRLFPDAPVRGVECIRRDIAEFDKVGRIGRVFKIDYQIGNAGKDRVFGRYPGHERGFVPLFLQEAGITMDMPTIQPRIIPEIRMAALERMRSLRLVPGKTVLLAPTTSSQREIDLNLWPRIADTLRSRGFSVATNCGPNESPVPGTAAWETSLSELYAGAELAGYLITARSGVCELCATAKTAMHILWPDQILVAWPGISTLWRLSDNGLPDKASYHEYHFDEPIDLFVDRVLQHPDFQNPPEAAQR